MNNSDLSARLKNLLLVVDQSSSKSPQENDAVPMQRQRKPLVLESVATNNGKRKSKQKEDEPPSIHYYVGSGSSIEESIPFTQTSPQLSSSTMNPLTMKTSAPAPSLAVQMMATAASVQKSQKQQQRNEQQHRAQNATFGMKKGFLMKEVKPRKKVTSSDVKNAKEVYADITRSSAIQKVRRRMWFFPFV